MLLRQLKSTRETDRGSTQPAPSPCWEVYFLIFLFLLSPLWCSRMQHHWYLLDIMEYLWNRLGENHTLRGQLAGNNFKLCGILELNR